MSPSDLGSQSKELLLVQDDETIEVPSGNDLAVLQELADSFGDIGAVSFQGIRRKLGLHQETLSRSLRRLERDGLIDKSDHDYKISKKGSEILSHGKRKHGSDSIPSVAFPIPILRTILPPQATEFEIESALSHKWFGSLRWYGSSSGDDGTILSWTTDDGKLRLSARIADGYLTVESEATTKDSMDIAIKAAYEIFDHVSKAFKYRDMIPARERQGSLVRAG